MKSMKTLMISAVVCGAMALPLSGVAQSDIEYDKGLAFLIVQNIVCGKTKQSDEFPRDKKTCTPIGKYIKANGIDALYTNLQSYSGDAPAAFVMVQNIVCGKTKQSGEFPRDKKTCTPIGKYIKANGIDALVITIVK